MLGAIGKGRFEGCRGVVTATLAQKSRLNGHSKYQVKVKWTLEFSGAAPILAGSGLYYTPTPLNRSTGESGARSKLTPGALAANQIGIL
jgi:hypothetical protein